MEDNLTHRTVKTSTKKGRISPEDYAAVANALKAKFKQMGGPSSSSAPPLESDEQRLARLREEEKARIKQERAEKREADKQAKQDNQTPLDQAKEKAAKMIKICQRLVIELKIKEGHLKNVQLARQVREAIGSLAKDMETCDASLRKYESESNVGKMKQITQKLATMAEKKKDLDKLARPFLNM